MWLRSANVPLSYAGLLRKPRHKPRRCPIGPQKHRKPKRPLSTLVLICSEALRVELSHKLKNQRYEHVPYLVVFKEHQEENQNPFWDFGPNPENKQRPYLSLSLSLSLSLRRVFHHLLGLGPSLSTGRLILCLTESRGPEAPLWRYQVGS